MGRRARRQIANVKPERRLSTEEMRTALYPLAREFAELSEPSESLVDRAVEFGPRGRGGAWIIPEVDGRAMIARLEELEDELEDIGIVLLAEQRLAQPTPAEELIPVEELAGRFGFGDLLEG